MLQAFIVTLREGVEAALIVGITLAYLAKIGRPELRKAVLCRPGCGICREHRRSASPALASRSNQDIFEGWVMLVAAFFVITMIIFMMRTGRSSRDRLKARSGRWPAEGSRVGLFAVCLPDGICARAWRPFLSCPPCR